MNKETLNTINNFIEEEKPNRDQLISFLKQQLPKKMGRKPLPKEKRCVNVMIRIPAKEKQVYQKEARQKGVSLSKLIREKLVCLEK